MIATGVRSSAVPQPIVSAAPGPDAAKPSSIVSPAPAALPVNDTLVVAKKAVASAVTGSTGRAPDITWCTGMDAPANGDKINVRTGWASLPFLSTREVIIDWAVAGTKPGTLTVPLRRGVGVTYGAWNVAPSDTRLLALCYSDGLTQVYAARACDGCTVAEPLVDAVLLTGARLWLDVGEVPVALTVSGPQFNWLSLDLR